MTKPDLSFAVIGGAAVAEIVDRDRAKVVEVVESAYRLHGEGETVVPPSYFLHPLRRPGSRIIALPASVGGEVGVDGLKWIASYPDNVRDGLPRASAVVVLNRPDNGYPFACIEASIVSAARTAASAALAARHLRPEAAANGGVRAGFYGTGLIARYVHDFLVGTGWRFSEVGAYDLVEGYAESFLRHAAATGAETIPYREGRDLLARSDLVVFATTAARPYVEKGAWLDRGPLVLHLSLRDLSPSVVHEVANVVDDVDHVFQANTSLQLAEAETGDRSFVTGTLHDVLSGRVAAPADGPVVFSPFGLGVLDVALAKHVYDEAIRAGTATLVPGFFHELSRHGA